MELWNICLPPNYKELLPEFYKQKAEEKLKRKVKELESMINTTINKVKIQLKWSEEGGLVAITVNNSQCTLKDEEVPYFAEKNPDALIAFLPRAVLHYYKRLLHEPDKPYEKL